MRRLSRIRLAGLLAPFALGLLCEDRLGLGVGPLAVACALGLVLRAALAAGRRPRAVACLAVEGLLGCSLGALSLAQRLGAPRPALSGPLTALTLLEAPQPALHGCRALAFLHSASAGRVLLQAPPALCDALPGQRWLARLSLDALPGPSNPGASDRARRWARRGVTRTARVERALVEPLGEAPRSARAALERLRRRIAVLLDPLEAPQRAGALLRALVLGERAQLRTELREPFERSGTAHLLAVSGLHVGWVFALTRFGVSWLLRCVPGLWLARRASAVAPAAALLAAGGYALLTGLALPALRAGAMAAAGTVAVLGGRPAATWNALAAAALLVLASEPAALFEPAFALSFAAVAGILLWQPRGGAAGRLLGCTAGASLATAPLLAALGAPLPAGGLVANALCVPWFASVVVPLGLVAGLGGVLDPRLAALLQPWAAAAAELGIRLVDALVSPDLFEGVVRRGRAACLGAGALLALRLLWRGARAQALALAVLLGAAAALATLLDPEPARERDPSFLFLDVRHGDAVLVRGPRGAWLVDAGPSLGSFDAGRSSVLPALRAEGVARLERLVVSHADLDHIGGAASVVSALPVGEIWLTAATYRSEAALPLRRAAARRRTPLRLVAAPVQAEAAGLRAQVLWPPPGDSEGASNAGSLVLRIDGPNACAMLGGDIPARVERRLAPGLAACALLKLSHHGSRSSSDALWLARLAPDVAVASAERRMHAPLPHPDVRARLRAGATSVWETWRFGAVRVRFSAVGPVVEPWRMAAGEPDG